MSGNLAGFDASTVKPNTGFDPIPAGKYVCVIADSELVDTNDRTGKRLKLTLEVVEGDFKGRKVFSSINVRNKSDECQRIGQGQLSAICYAVGNLTPKDSSELHNKPILVGVKLKKREDTGEMANEVSSYASVKQGTAAAPAAAAPAAARKGGPGAKPW